MSNRERRFLFLVLIAAIAVRVWMIALHVYAPDQSFTVDLGRSSWAGLVHDTGGDTHPPFYYCLIKIWFMFTPTTLGWAQAFTVLLSIPTLLSIFRLGRDHFSPAAGWIGLLFASFMPYQVYWSHAARNHQLMSLAVSLLVWTTYRWVEHPSARRWWAMAGSMALMIQTNYIGLVLIPVWMVAFGAFELSSWRRRWNLIAAVVPGALLFLPWVPIMIEQVRHGPMNHDFFQETVWPFYLFFHSIFGRVMHYQEPLPWPLFAVLALVFALIFAGGIKAVGRRWSWWVLMIGMPTVPVAVAYYANFTLAERHINFGIPLFMAYWGAACVEAVKRLKLLWRNSFVAEKQSEAERQKNSADSKKQI